MIYLLCYDITKPKRLQRTAKLLGNYGLRIQKSFFQCEINSDQFEILLNKLKKEINLKEDKLYVYPMCENCIDKIMSDGVVSILNTSSYEIL